MRLSDLSIRNPVFAWMLMLGLIVFGGICFVRLGVSQLPDADFPVLNVSIGLEGASPEIMETAVVDPVEDSIMGIQGVRSVSSSSKVGSANITIEFGLEKDIDVALQEVQTKVAQAQKRLPKDTDTPVITKTNPDDQPIIWLALTYDKDDREFMMRYARDYLKDRFSTVAGVGDIFLGGYTDPALRVWVKPEELSRRNISVNDIIDAIANEHTELPGGSIDEAKKSFNVRTMGEAKTVPEFESIVISRRAGQLNSESGHLVQLGQVAKVEESLDEIKRLSRFNSKMALGLGIRKQRGSNAVQVAKLVKEKMAEVEPTLPPGMHLSVNFDTTRFIEDSVHELNKHLVLAVILTSLVCWMFLGSWSATFNVLLSIPTSIVGAFIGLYFFGFTLNTFTLLGLTLAIGIVVDDAIMVLENIFRYNELGEGQIESAIIGAREIAFAAMAASVAVIAIFLPVAFMKGVIGKYFMQFGVTISLAVFLSLVESLTITPMRCAGFVSVGERTTKIGKAFDHSMEWLKKTYSKLLVVTLNHKWKVILGSVIFMFASFALVRFLNKEFTPAQDQSLLLVRLQLPVGSSLAYTDEATQKAEAWFLARPEVKQVYASVGGFSNGAADSNVAMMFVTMKAKDERKLTQQEFMGISRKEISKIPDVKAFIQDLSQRGFSAGRGFPIEFTILGPNWDELGSATQKIMAAMEASGLMTDIDTNYLLGMPEVQIEPDRQKAALYEVSVSAIAKTVNALIGGTRVGQYPKDGHRYDIRLQLVKQKRPVEEIKNLNISNNRSNLVPLSRVVNQNVRPSLQQISRINRQRAISIYANLKPGVSQQTALASIEASAKEILKPGYMIDQSGNSKTFKESFQGLLFALVLGLFVAYMVLASQFNSFLDPVTILMALPFSISGAFFALLITQQSLNIYSMIGILLLMGIVKKNSILLVEFANHLREAKMINAREALLEACPIRLRPIIMTSMATIAGAIPSATAVGAGAETMRPMAITLIGGVLLSTILTLIVVPAVYLAFDPARRNLRSSAKIKAAFAKVGDHGN